MFQVLPSLPEMRHMQQLLSVNELIINDSFYNYCHGKNEDDILYWEAYLETYPQQKEEVAEAKEMVLALGSMFANQQPAIEQPSTASEKQYYKHGLIRKIVRYTAAAAAVTIVVVVTKNIFYAAVKPAIPNETAAASASLNKLQYKTSNGERKLVVLSDSTKLYLNAGSQLTVAEGFGKTNRQVYLTGEALFDVTHNASLPFRVHTSNYDAKVLGTLFNVKAYPGDKKTETSLLRGKVEIQLKSNNQTIVLAPNQKVVIDNKVAVIDLKAGQNKAAANQPGIDMLPLTYSGQDNAVIETAWSQNRLEIIDESFAEMKEKLERWYNVKISFRDEAVSKYRFTGTFNRETIEQVLEAFKNADHFTYENTKHEVTISK